MMETSFSVPAWTGQALFATFLCLLLSRHLLRRQKTDEDDDIPMAHGRSLPLLGHALCYQQDPAGFLSAQTEPVYRINLAGRSMIVVGNDSSTVKQVATLPESTLSARQAVADIGVEYTLGAFNVHKGTDWHKRILKDCVYNNGDFERTVLPALFESLVDALDTEIDGLLENDERQESSSSVVLVNDLFALMRQCVLRAVLSYMIAPDILKLDDRLLYDFMAFQDALEDATAKAAVLPRFIAIPLFLKPVQRQRQLLVTRLSKMIDSLWNKEEKLGPWLQAFRSAKISSQQAAELTVGLLFAAHKNPAIGAAQCFCFLQTQATLEQQESCSREAHQLYTSLRNGPCPRTEALRRCVLETMRVTAHSIGAIRTAQKDVTLESNDGRTYSVNKGDIICISHIATHRNELVWGHDASDYKPDRWISETTTMDEYKFTTFSHGVHKCPGERLAISVMEIMLAILLERNAKLVGELAKISFERATLAQREGMVPITISTEKQ